MTTQIHLDEDEWATIVLCVEQEIKQVNPTETQYIEWLKMIVLKIKAALQ